MSKVKPKVLGAKPQRRGKDPLSGFLDPADAIVPCACGAKEGEPCVFVPLHPDAFSGPSSKRPKKEPPQVIRTGTVHFSRRMKRLLLTAAKPHLREEFEKQAVAMLRDYLKEKR